MRYSWSFIVRRLGLLVLIIWAAATLNFFIPKLTPRNPIAEKLLAETARTGYVPPGFAEYVESYMERFGLNKPLWEQYIDYVVAMARFDLGYSISNYPRTVGSLIGEALPWTLGLLLTATLIAFFLGTGIGALMGWPRASGFARSVLPFFLILGAIPAYVIALTLIYFVAFRAKLLPIGGGYGIGTIPDGSLSFFFDVVKHSLLPALALILASMGGWAIGMRGMMVTVHGEDYMVFAEAKGLKERRLFYKYGVRNALLPQVTGLALAVSFIVSGAVLVELVFGYPGLGSLLARSIRTLDYFTIYGIVFVIIVAIGLTMFIMDMIYPLLDPRISYHRD